MDYGENLPQLSISEYFLLQLVFSPLHLGKSKIFLSGVFGYLSRGFDAILLQMLYTLYVNYIDRKFYSYSPFNPFAKE